MPKKTGNQEEGGAVTKTSQKQLQTYQKSQRVNANTNHGFLLSSHVKTRLSKISLFDPLKIAKFFAKRTFRRTALEPRNQMRYFKFLLIDVHHR